jgi:hypothetical protein
MRLAAALILGATLAGIAAAREILITATQGTVEIQPLRQAQWIKARAGTILKTGDKIRTGRSGSVQSITKEGHKLIIRPGTLLEITQAGPNQWEFKQEIGKVRLSVAKLGSGQGLKVKTPTAVCSVRGTEFEVAVMEDRSTLLDVFHGIVAFGDAAGLKPEIPVVENQRSSIREGAAPQPPQAIPEQERGQVPGDGPKNDSKAEMKRELLREIGRDLRRDAIESAAAMDQQSAEYEQAKTLIDAFGQRVRVEEYVTRPSPESFKFVSLNTRANRFDYGFVEVVANKPLPQDLNAAGNLWFAQGDNKPEWYAVQERWFVTNTGDTFTGIAVDGDSMQVTFQKPFYSNDGQFLGVTDQKGWQTVFNHRYEFLNGDPGGMQRIWNDRNFRPYDNGTVSGTRVEGLMAHFRPVQVELYDPVSAKVLQTFWQDVFATNNAGAPSVGDVGKSVFVSFKPDAGNPFLAHFSERRSYINFMDGNGNGYLDTGERYQDLNHNGVRDGNEPFFDEVRLSLNGTFDGSRTFSASGDTQFFVDRNRNGARDAATEPFGVPSDLARSPRAWLVAENFMINDQGRILDSRDPDIASVGRGSEGEDSVSNLFKKVNYERTWTSSEFGDRKIDLVFNPTILLRSGDIKAKVRGDQQ